MQGGISAGIRKDFGNTATGNTRKDGRILSYEEGIGIIRNMIETVDTSNTVVAVPTATTSEEQQIDGIVEENRSNAIKLTDVAM